MTEPTLPATAGIGGSYWIRANAGAWVSLAAAHTLADVAAVVRPE